MKKSHFKMMTVTAMIALFMCTSCGEGKTIVQTADSPNTSSSVSDVNNSNKDTGLSNPTPEEGDDLAIAKSEEPFDFCTKYSKDYSYLWDEECGIVIYPETTGSIPYVMVWRSYDNDSTAADLHEADASEFYFEYGNDLLAASDPTTYSIAGKNLSGAEYQYMVGEYKVTLLRLIDETPKTGYVLYTAKYLDDSKEKTLEALEVAIENYQLGKDFYERSTDDNETVYEIVPSITQTIQYETYCDGWYSVDIPKGWAVEADSFDSSAAAFEIHIFDPQHPDRQLYTALQALWFDSESSYTKLSNYIMAGSSFKGLPYLLGGSDAVAEMYQNFSVFKNSNYGQYMSFTNMNDWTEIEKFGTTPLGGELIRGYYTNDNGEEIEGIFSGNWKAGMKIYGYVYPGVIYSPMFFTAPSDEFNEWAEILNHCYCSLTYSEEYIDQYYKEESATMKAFQANTQIYNEMSDMITSSWYERQTTYDTISAKTSDATLGYDRVYNTETGEVYRVTTGFMDSYSGTLYSSIDESMYSLPIAGYIY